MWINSWDTNVSILSSSLLARTSILSCFFFFFLVIINNFLIIPLAKEKTTVKLVLAILTGAPITVVKEMIDTSLLVVERTIKTLSK